MKAISLTQPWSSLVAAGEKRIETRSWYTNFRGALAIHASKSCPREYQLLCFEEPFYTALLSAGLLERRRSDGNGVPGQLAIRKDCFPLGAVIAVARLVDVIHIPLGPRQFHVRGNRLTGLPRVLELPPPEPELCFGDYTPGRYAWLLDAVRPLPRPIYARGAIGLWNWDHKSIDWDHKSIE